jgi:hypothetical protein
LQPAREEPPSDRLEAALAANEDFPVASGAAVDPMFCRRGETCHVVVIVRIAKGWHIYPMDRSAGPELPTSLQADAPAETHWTGPWRAQRSGDGAVYEGTTRFVRALQIGRDARGEMNVPVKLTYEACDAFSCRPPVRVPLTAIVKVSSR